MTRYSRSVIPGRPQGEQENASDIDRLVFGKGGAKAAANDEEDPDFLPPAEEKDLVDRAGSDRRKGPRRKSEFAPLPKEARGYKSPDEGSKRGPLLLVGALVIVGVFSVVVWNAYRDGVKAEDSDGVVDLASAGPIKTKPEGSTKAKADGDVQAGVFDQIEKTGKPVAAPAPEMRDEPPVPAASVAPAPAPAKTAAAAPAPVPSPVKVAPPAPVKTAGPAPATAATVPVAKPVAAAPAEAPKPVSPAVVSAPAPKTEPVALSGGYKPAFTAGGTYVVQIAAPSTEAAAAAEWDKRAKANPDLFGAAEKIIVQADVNGRTVYRLRVGAFATPADAEAFCTAYKAKGGACFRTAK